MSIAERPLIAPRATVNLAVFPIQHRNLLLAVLVVALLVRLGAMFALHTWSFQSEREFGYETGEIGYAIANGQGFSWPQTWRAVGPLSELVKRDHPVPTTWEAPIYPLIVGAAFWVFGSYSVPAAVALELFQVGLCLLTCYVLFRLGKLLFNEQVGLLAAFIFAVYPSAIHFSVQKTEHPMLLVLLSLLLILQTLELAAKPSLFRSIGVGILCGAAILVNPVVISFYPFALVWLLLNWHCGWGERLKSGMVIMGVCAITLLPWVIRNYVVFNQFIFIRPNFTWELVRSNFPEPRQLPATAGLTPNDGELSKLYNQKAAALVVANPIRLIRNSAERAITYWTQVDFASARIREVVGVAYYSVLIFGLAGMWLGRRSRQVSLLFIFILMIPLPFYVTWVVMGRYRFPVEAVLILFASYSAIRFLNFWQDLRSENPTRA